jgi:hypothetical protein
MVGKDERDMAHPIQENNTTAGGWVEKRDDHVRGRTLHVLFRSGCALDIPGFKVKSTFYSGFAQHCFLP